GSADENPVADAYGTAVACQGFPHAATVQTQAPGALSHGLGYINAGKLSDVMAQVACRGQIGGTAVFIAAIARQGLGAGQGGSEKIMVPAVECEIEHSQIIAAVLSLSEPCPEDDRGHGLLLEHPARCHIGN